MSEDKTKETIDTTTDEPSKADEPEPKSESEDIPTWGKKLMESVDSLAEKVGEAMTGGTEKLNQVAQIPVPQPEPEPEPEPQPEPEPPKKRKSLLSKIW